VIAREIIAQAEHDARAIVLVVALGSDVAARIENAVASLIQAQPRRAIISEALAARGGILVADTFDAAIDAANEFAPEHLLIAAESAERALTRVRNAGTVFVGQMSSVVFGDYITGANHVLPTGGAARSASGLSTADFVRWTTIQRVSDVGASTLATDAAVFADAEALPGHAAAAHSWCVS
jgi:histidinol dehydrogenase